MTRTRAEEYRRLARECLDVARTVQNEERQTAFLQMAQVWQRLADEQDHVPDLSEVPAPPPATEQIQPAAQQQQQIQSKDEDKKE